MINKPPPLNRDYNRDPNMKALKRRGFIDRGSTLWVPIYLRGTIEFVKKDEVHWGQSMDY